MSVSSYRLETPRPRPLPPPLRFKDSSFSPSSTLTSKSETLLYDLPSAPSMSPPPGNSKTSMGLSPTSPSFPGRSRGARKARTTPPPAARNRSTTPVGVSPSELEQFAEQCRAWYFEQDDNAGRQMTQTLANLQPSQRAPFSRLQASIRSTYHANVNSRRNAEFHAHLSATQPGGSLMPHARANPHGPTARKERYERLTRFVRAWCTMGMPGTKPFFEALWAVLRLQVVPRQIGGAGGYRIEWEFDDAVFKESAGKDFMLEAIDILKGVLGFEEVSSSAHASTPIGFDASPLHSRAQSKPLSPTSPRTRQPLSATAPVQAKRARAPSDPFLDTPALSRSVASATSQSSGNTATLLALASEPLEEPPSPISPAHDAEELMALSRSDRDVSYDADDTYLRKWTSPDLYNPEILALLDIFPGFITRRALPRFPVTADSHHADIEEAEDERGEGKEIRFGTGTMWVSAKLRTAGWEGSWWSRFLLWWRKTFSFC